MYLIINKILFKPKYRVLVVLSAIGLRVVLTAKGSKNENGKIALPESVSVHPKYCAILKTLG